MGNINNKKRLLIANSNHIIDLLNIQGREHLVDQNQMRLKLDTLSDQLSTMQEELDRLSNKKKQNSRPKSEYIGSKYKRQDGQVGHQKQRRTYSIRNAIIDPEFFSGNTSSE